MNNTDFDDLKLDHYELFKIVYGVKPRWIDYNTFTLESLQEEVDFLVKQAKEQAAQEEIENEHEKADNR